jgi:dipeptidyl aminopeptidase/acylaminoacyl peptidase
VASIFGVDGLVVSVDEGAGKYLERISKAVFSPDGEALLVSGQIGHDYYVLGLARDGRAERLSVEGMDVVGFGWMPDSRSVLVADASVSDVLDDEPDHTALYEVGLDGNIRREIEMDRQLRVSNLAVSHSGDYAILSAVPPMPAVVAPTDLYRLDIDTGKVEQLTDTPETYEEEPLILTDDSVVFVTHEAVARISDDGALTTLAIADGPASPTITADGEQLLFAARVPTLGRTIGIYRVPVAGGDPEYLDIQGRYPAASSTRPGFVVFVPGSPSRGGDLVWHELERS